MTLFFSTVLNEIYDAWLPNRDINKMESQWATDHTRSKLSIINTVYKTISVPANIKNRDGKHIHVKNDDVRGLFVGTKQADKRIVANRNHISLEQKMPATIEKEIVKYLDQNKIDLLISNLLAAVLNDVVFDNHVKSDVNESASRKKLTYFLMRVIRLSLGRANNKPVPIERLAKKDFKPHDTSVKHGGNGLEHSAGKNDISQTILANSKNRFQECIKDYTPDPALCPAMSGEIKKHTLIVSDGGAGKTTWMYKHWGILLEGYKSDPGNARIPIYIQLNGFDGSNTNNLATGAFVKIRIAQQYAGLRQEDGSSLLKQINPDQYVLLLDGMNEAKNSDALGAEIKELKDAGFHIILTSRRELNWEIREDFSVVTLERFSEEKINQILRDHGFSEATGRLLTTLDRPMFLALYLGLGKDAKNLQCPGELFLAHHKWIKKMFSVDKHGPAYHKQGNRLLGNVLPNLATQTKSIVFSDTDVAGIFNNLNCNSDEALAILCETGIIIDEGYDEYKAVNVYRWKHEFFLQFYQAMRIWQQMGYSADKRTFQAIRTLPQELFQRDIDDHVLAFLGDILESQFVGKTTITSPMSPVEKWLQDNCQRQSMASKQHTDNEIQACTANLIKTMILARDGHLEHTVFDGLDLLQVALYECWLTGSRFAKCRNINKDNFCAAGHEYRPSSFAVSRKQNLLFSSSNDETCVLVWDLSTNKAIKRINCVDKVTSIAISPDEKWLAVQHAATHTIQLFNLDDWAWGTKTSPKIFKLGPNQRLLEPGVVFFDSQSEILFCLLQENAFCLRWSIASETDIEGFSIAEGISNQTMQSYENKKKYCICSSTDKLFALRPSDIGIYNIRTGQEERAIKPKTPITDICVTPDGERLAALDVATGSGMIYVYGLADGIEDYAITLEDNGFIAKVFATDGFVCGVQASTVKDARWEINRMEYYLYAWKFSDSEEAAPIIIKDANYTHAYAAPKEEMIFCASTDTHIRVIDLASNKETTLLGHGTSYYSTNVHFTDIEGLLFRRYENGDVFLLDLDKRTSARIPKLSKFLKSNGSDCWEYKFNGHFLFVHRFPHDVVIWDVLNDEYKDTIPGSLDDITIAGENNDIIINQNSELGYSVWRMPGHQLLGEITWNEMWAKTLLVNDTADFSVDNWLDDTLRIYCVVPALFSVVIGYPDGTIGVWNILSGQKFEANISCYPIKQVRAIPGTDCICIVAGDGMVTLYDIKKKIPVCEWDASEYLHTSTGYTLISGVEERMARVTIIPVTEDISVVDCGLGPGGQGYFFVKHFANGVCVGDNIPSIGKKIVVSRNGKTLIRPHGMGFVVYDIPHIAWDERHNIAQNDHYDVSPDGNSVLCASENGDVIVFGVHDRSKFVWTKSDSIDLSDCDFRNSSNLDEKLKTFLRMNDAIV